MIARERHGARIRVDAMAIAAPGYDVIVRHGALAELGERIAAAAPAAAYAVITPHSIHETVGARALADLRAAGLHAELLAFDDREVNKTRETWAALTDRMLELRFGRDSCVVAVGGGVTGDVAGFVAATYMRGIPFVQVPTTLLAMIDASIGGKTGVDTHAGKNLVGAFHSPAVVVIDPSVLETLPALHIQSGLAEAVKHGAILDAAYFEWIASNARDLLALDASALEHLIARSVELKAGIVSADPREDGRRAILNFGHTIAHALERYAGYTMSHGAAVSVGMCAEAAVGEAVGTTNAGTAQALRSLLSTLGLPTRSGFDPAALLDTMAIDKKSRAARPRFALLRSIGECAVDTNGMWTHAIDSQVLKRVLEETAVAHDRV
ncbi:MAG TPA: 3-dehydroquinate synthase [Longimicrobiales bacterium]|nr:3-dehydroquinate synthase [Longimicrobiales bacterium]